MARAASTARLIVMTALAAPGCTDGGASMVQSEIAFTVLVCAVAGFFLWRARERRLAAQRRGLRTLYALSEEIISARSPSEILGRLLTTLPRLSEAARARLYLHNRKARMLDRVPSALDPEPLSLSIDSPVGPPLCFRNRTLLTIPDTRRSRYYESAGEEDAPRSVVFVPMLAENEILGVLEIGYAEGARQFSHDHQAAAQHLGNQIAIALKLQQQQSIREQLFRSEKLAAAGQLVSGVVNELQAPLESMATRAALLVSRRGDSLWQRDLGAIASEAKRAAEIVSRLVSFSRAEQPRAEPVDLNGLLAGLMEFREREWKVKGFQVRNLLSSEPLTVLGSQAQLEQVFLNLLVHAEQSQTDAERKTITVSTRVLAQRALVEIEYSGPSVQAGGSDPFQDGGSGESAGLGLAVCRGIIQSHGGEVRLVHDASAGSRFEVELPAAPQVTREQVEQRSGRDKSARRLTALLLEPETAVQRRLISLLSACGHRVVPVADGEQAADLVRRLRFDLVLCSVHLPGSNWVEFYERVRHHVGAFALLTEGYDDDLSRALQGSAGFVLRKPINEAEVGRLLDAVESRMGERPAVPPEQ